MTRNPLICVCGKICFSKSGLTNHHKICDKAKEARTNGSSTSKSVSVDVIEYVKDVKDFLVLAEEIASDAHNALTVGNKSAARRSRRSLNILRFMIPNLRKLILERVKNKA